MNILPILNNPDPTPRSSKDATVYTSTAEPFGDDHENGDLWNEVDWDGSCVIAVHAWSDQAGGWVQVKP